MRRKKARRWVAFWIGLAVLALNQVLDMTLVLSQGRIDSVYFSFTLNFGQLLLPLSVYGTLGLAFRLGSKVKRRRASRQDSACTGSIQQRGPSPI